MPASKHFFEGYCRAKDMLNTLATKISEATITRPWTIKSTGRIIATNQLHAERAEYHNKYHVCLRRELENGDIINLLLVDEWNTPTNNVWGYIKISVCDYDSCVASEGRFSHTLIQRWQAMQYYTNQVADTEASPQLAWYWIWVDNDSVIVNVFGNAGGAGTATPTRGVMYFGKAVALLDEFRDTIALNTPGKCNLRSSRMIDYVIPTSAPGTWATTQDSEDFCGDMIGANFNTSSNPLASGELSVRIPKIIQSQIYDWTQAAEKILTHALGTGQYLVCPPGSVNLLRSDILTVDELNADYINTAGSLSGWNRISDLALIKRMESAHTLSVIGTVGNVTVTWNNPSLCHGVKIMRKVGTAPNDHADGDEIFNLNSDNGLLLGSQQVYVDSTCEAGNHYYYRAFAYDSTPIYSVPVTSAQADIQL